MSYGDPPRNLRSMKGAVDQSMWMKVKVEFD